MSIEERLKDLILSRYKSVLEFTESIGMPYGTMQSIFKRGIHNSSVTNIIKICNALGISTDELAHDHIVPVDSKDKRPVIREMTEFLKMAQMNIDNFDLAIDGVTMSTQEIHMMLDALEIEIGIIRRMRKRS